ncbi:MAG: hypothetical protein HY708_07245 [Ignavibacteriae bacterium]|nr:hypothetical protein [Ignavibacteriota bacterium]
MSIRKFAASLTLIIGILLVLGSCKDFGDEVIRRLTASTFVVNLSPGGTANVTISGGNPPYSISRHPDPALASASLTNLANGNGELTITVPSSVGIGGTTDVRIKDSDTHDSPLDGPTHEENEIVITIVVGAAPPVSFSGDIQPIFDNNCTVSCHPGNNAPFSLRVGQSHALLVNSAAIVGPCAGIPRVKPFDAEGSALYRRLQGTTCGSQMPMGQTPLHDSLRTKIRVWINEGAQNN